MVNKLICQQHGFVPNKSCVANLLEAAEMTTKAAENKRPVDMMDFAKAFDKVPLARLLLKIRAYSIGRRVLQ